MENTDERGWRFVPHGWARMRTSVDLGLDALRDGFPEAVYRNALAEELNTPRPQWRRVLR
jgi:hypothetical protein